MRYLFCETMQAIVKSSHTIGLSAIGYSRVISLHSSASSPLPLATAQKF